MDDNHAFFQNQQLDGGDINFEGDSTGILLIHGFTATTTEVSHLADAFSKMGFTVSAPLLPGHGTTPQDLNLVKYQDWTECVESAFIKLAEYCQKIIVGGESMGAVLSLFLAEKYSEIDALLIYSPAIFVESIRFAKFMKWFSPTIDKPKSNGGDNSWQGYTVYPLSAAHEFNKLQNKVERNLARIKQPALILHGMYDNTIDKECGQLVFDNIQSDNKDFQLMQNSGHVMLLDREFAMIFQLTIEFLKSANIL